MQIQVFGLSGLTLLSEANQGGELVLTRRTADRPGWVIWIPASCSLSVWWPVYEVRLDAWGLSPVGYVSGHVVALQIRFGESS